MLSDTVTVVNVRFVVLSTSHMIPCAAQQRAQDSRAATDRQVCAGRYMERQHATVTTPVHDCTSSEPAWRVTRAERSTLHSAAHDRPQHNACLSITYITLNQLNFE